MAATLVHRHSSHHCARFARNVLASVPNLFPFVTDPTMDSTNNRAQHALRPTVVAREVSGGSRTDKGGLARAILSSILRSMDQRALDLFEDTPQGPPHFTRLTRCAIEEPF